MEVLIDCTILPRPVGVLDPDPPAATNQGTTAVCPPCKSERRSSSLLSPRAVAATTTRSTLSQSNESIRVTSARLRMKLFKFFPDEIPLLSGGGSSPQRCSQSCLQASPDDCRNTCRTSADRTDDPAGGGEQKPRYQIHGDHPAGPFLIDTQVLAPALDLLDPVAEPLVGRQDRFFFAVLTRWDILNSPAWPVCCRQNRRRSLSKPLRSLGSPAFTTNLKSSFSFLPNQPSFRIFSS